MPTTDIENYNDIQLADGVTAHNGSPDLEHASDMINAHDDIQLAPGVEAIDETPAKAFGGGISPIELRGDNDFEDQARRLILWSYAAAPIARPLSRAEGGAIDDPPIIDHAFKVLSKYPR